MDLKRLTHIISFNTPTIHKCYAQSADGEPEA